MESLVGSTGTVRTATRGQEGPGEIIIKNKGLFIAYSQDPLPRGTKVMIDDERGNRTVEVISIER